MFVKIFFLLFLILTQPIYGKRNPREETCSYVDLRNPPLNIIRNQTSLSWCYAFAAADMISSRMGVAFPESNTPIGDQHFISAISVANAYIEKNTITVANTFNRFVLTVLFSIFNPSKFAQTDEETLDSGGVVKDAIDAALNGNICLEKDLPSSDTSSYFMHNDSETIETFATLGTFNMLISQIKSYSTDYQKAKDVLEKEALVIGLSLNLEDLYPGALASLGTDKSNSIIKDMLTKGSERNIINKLVESIACSKESGKRIDFSHKKTYFQTELVRPILLTTRKHLIAMIDLELDDKDKKGKSKRPDIIAISIKGNFLQDISDEDDSDHAVTIVGRSYDRNLQKCKYLIRNSYGLDFMPKNEKFINDHGSVWVFEEDLEIGLEDIVRFKA